MCSDRSTCAQVREFLQTWSEMVQIDGENDTGESDRIASAFMRRKLRAYLAWRSDFTRFKSSSIMEKQKQADAAKNSHSVRKGSVNKRRRVRGGAQGFSVGIRDENDENGIIGYGDVGRASAKLSETFITDMRGALDEEELIGPIDLTGGDYEMHDMDNLIIVHPYGGDSDDSLLEELRPKNVIMYNPNASFVRRVEVRFHFSQ